MEQRLIHDTVEGGETLRTRAATVSMVCYDDDEVEVEKSLAELARLLDTAGADTVFSLVQNKFAPDPRYLLGSGKVAELAAMCHMNEVSLVVFDMDLSPSQIRNLEDAVSTEQMPVRVIDRSMLILDIFALHASSGEGKLQVELAQLKYTAPRLVGHGTEMSRLLKITTPGIKHLCRNCGKEFEFEKWILKCPGCGQEKLHRVNGNEFILESAEVENV